MIYKIRKSIYFFLLLSSPVTAQTYSVQKVGGQTVVVQQGVIKSGPRSYSAFDPANVYRSSVDYNGKSGYQRATESAEPIVNKRGNYAVEPRGNQSGNGVYVVSPITPSRSTAPRSTKGKK